MSLVNSATDESKVILDSLPYIESVHEDYEEYALALIEEEMQNFKPRSLSKIPPLRFRTSLMQKEYDGLQVEEDETTGERTVVNPNRDSNTFQPLKIARPTNLDEWRSHAIPQMKSRFEAERIRGIMLEAEKEKGVQIWKDYNAILDNLKGHWSSVLKNSTEKVEEINYQRQESQAQNYGPELTKLEQEYQQALYRRNQVEHAIEALKRGATLSGDASRKRKADDS